MSFSVPFLTSYFFFLFFFNDTATTEIYTLSLHDALPISSRKPPDRARGRAWPRSAWARPRDRKSTRLNSSHTVISYAVFCLKKKKKKKKSKEIKIKKMKKKSKERKGQNIKHALSD